MAKLLLLLLVVVAVLWLLRRSRRDSGDGPGKHASRPGPPPAQPIVACVHCGVHLPRADAVADAAGRLFCSEAHRLAGPR